MYLPLVTCLGPVLRFSLLIYLLNLANDEITPIPNATHSPTSNREYGRSQGDTVRDGLKIKAPGPNASESVVTTQQLPSPQASASGDEPFPNLARSLASKPFSNSEKVRVNCPIAKWEEPFFAVPIKKPLQVKSILRGAVGRRDQKFATRLAQAGFLSPGASLTPKFPGHMANKLGWSHKVSWKSHLSPRAQSVLQTSLIDKRLPNDELRRSARLASIDRPISSGRIQKLKSKDEKEKKKKQEAVSDAHLWGLVWCTHNVQLRRSQMKAHIESEPLDVLLEQLRARGEHGFLNLEEVERKRKEREIEIQRLRAEDVSCLFSLPFSPSLPFKTDRNKTGTKQNQEGSNTTT